MNGAATDGGHARYDVVVVGSGIAGLFTALKAAPSARVAVVTKAALEESNTRYAQGGIAAAWSSDDSPTLHASDTLLAGDGLSDPRAVRVLAEEGPARVRELINAGLEVDALLGLEAAHSRPRILHAGGDATGAAVVETLTNAVRAADIDIHERARVTRLATSGDRVTGVVLGDGSTLAASAVVLATGGAGQVYLHTTNPAVATGDGVTLALRAGAVVADAEFYQFHPTALAVPGAPSFLVSEAVRGEGGLLLDEGGRRFTDELARRDVVARAIATQMDRQEGWPVVLDVRHLGADFLRQRFPSIDATLRQYGLDWSRRLVPVTPAAHYWMGGVLTNLWGETTVPGLYAVGEVAVTGVHGANRLASNSLLEGLVFGARIAERLAGGRTGPAGVGQQPVMALPVARDTEPLPSREALRHLMWSAGGLVRTEGALTAAHDRLSRWVAADAEDANLLTCARLITAAALARRESRGAHFRRDHPEPATDTATRHMFVQHPTEQRKVAP